MRIVADPSRRLGGAVKGAPLDVGPRASASTFGLLLAAAFVVLVLRDVSTRLPHQLGDEATYLLESRHFLKWDLVRSLGYVPYPGLVFLAIASLFAHSSHAYLLIKVWNAACLAAAVLPAFFVARRVMPSGSAMAAALLVTVVPSTIYGTYFTPEATYILVFWTFTALAVAALQAPRRHGLAAAAGVTGAVAFLVKPHALALLVSYAVAAGALWLLARRTARRSRRTANADAFVAGWTTGGSGRSLVVNVGWFAIAALLTLVALGRVFASDGSAAFDLALYSNLLGVTQSSWQLSNVASLAQLLALHAAAIVSALAIPLPLFVALMNRDTAAADADAGVLAVFSAVTVSTLVIMTAKATVDFHVLYGATNTADRLHLRYYSFAFPLLIFVGASRLPDRAPEGSPRLILSAAIAIVATVASMSIVRQHDLTFVDAPDLTFLLFGDGLLAGVAASSALAIAIALGARKVRVQWLFLGCWAVGSLVNVTAATRLQQNEERVKAGDQAVDFLRETFDPADLDRGIVVKGAYPTEAMRAAFRLASLSPVLGTPEEARSRLNPATEWILVLGDRTGDTFDAPAIFVDDSAIYLVNQRNARTASGALYFFGASSLPHATARPAYAPEAWGRWLSGSTATIDFPDPLPDQGRLAIRARVFDAAAQGSVTIVLCEQAFPLRLTGRLAVHHLSYRCPYGPQRLALSGMVPVVPAEAGRSTDSRALSVGLATIRLE
jgi:phosphoglycerol transferase